MATCNHYQTRLRNLDNQIAAYRAQISTLDAENRFHTKAAKNAAIRTIYFRFARALRSPAQNYSLWRPGLLLVAAAVTAIAGFIFFDLLSFSTGFKLTGTLLGGIAMPGILTLILNYPKDHALPAALANAEAGRQHEIAQRNSLVTILTRSRHALAALSADRRQLLSSIEWRRASLLQRNWRAMRGKEWEDYLAEVFCALGAETRSTGKCGDHGVDLVVQFGNRCIAVQAKGYHHSVGNDAVQQVVAGSRCYGCNSTAVITNSYFTNAAQYLAQVHNCRLIGEAEFPDFVMGIAPI